MTLKLQGGLVARWPPRQLLCSLALLLLLHIRTANAQACGDNATSCEDCLDTLSCAWAPVAGCLTSCDVIADTSCFTQETLPDNTTQETCQLAADQQADAELCSEKMNCDECVATTLSDGNSSCQWFEMFAYCASGCDMNGCGNTTCAVATANTSSCDGVESCEECIDASCGWAQGAGCLESCDMIADISCFDADTLPDKNTQETCQVSADQQADAQLCSGKMDCDECVATTLADGNSTCQWFEMFGYCGSGCDMNGCGETTCASSTANSSCAELTCAECLDSSCAWTPEEGCLESCDIIADTSCFPAEDYNATDVCSSGEVANPPSPNPTSSSRRLVSNLGVATALASFLASAGALCSF